MSDDQQFRFRQIYVRNRMQPSKPFERTRPKMPSGPWRAAAVICFLVGAGVAWLLFGDSNAAVLRVLFGGLVGFAVGMYVVEGVWERWYWRRHDPPASPIGPRR
ncbi:MAG: hypothetical protein QNJ12_00445 [Ilumatobacter sp.]|uniref:hypothetical protein n=1 Tax=Ilumatobacter sp. TaxID=1967498 RepID=UPI00262CC86F|nr:hypothetical protein [Ilumatobacter sp.]MDJ0767220.1 hypothetical protein [Ilumatobacter sp.]